MTNQKKAEDAYQKHWIRLAKLLASRLQSGLPIEEQGDGFIVQKADRSFRFSAVLVGEMRKRHHILIEGQIIKLTATGLLEMKNRLGLSFAESQIGANRGVTQIKQERGTRSTAVNNNESPLVRLYCRKLPKGGSYISENELRAGERLRRDFERGQLQPKISANLERSIGNTGSSGHGGGQISDISDFAIDARARVNKAIQLLGPELSGVAIDICCFLKGLELVERERQWPPRSAKLMLRTALSMLAKHYGFEPPVRTENAAIRFWGDDTYRPTM